MKASNLPVRTWYLAMIFMTCTKKGFSACELQRQLGHNRYDTVWSLMHRIRNAMGNRDSRYTLEGLIVFDEGYFGIATPDGIKLKRGRSSQKQTNVAVIAESTYVVDVETETVSKSSRYFKIKALKTHVREEINETVKQSIDNKSILFSDKSTSYIDIADLVETHIMVKSTKEATKTTLNWIHIAISNTKS